ncbi:MAG: DUF2304 domain-containing protein [Leucobacter sp.]|jgi:hypothetical protein|nr:DUF2304 domain-containing protein [Leucobacter sp.]
MIIFQLLLIIGVVIAALLAIRFLPGDHSLAIKRLLALLFAVAAVLSIIFPTALTALARIFGIGRGADLLLYVSIVAMLLFAVATVRAKARSDARVTDLARAMALMEARLREQQRHLDDTPTDRGETA